MTPKQWIGGQGVGRGAWGVGGGCVRDIVDRLLTIKYAKIFNENKLVLFRINHCSF